MDLRQNGMQGPESMENGQQPVGEKNEEKPEIDLHVAPDNMSAYIQVKIASEGQTLTKEDVVSFLKENGISYGILDAVIQDYCENKKFFLQLLCARGMDPVDEEDTKIEYLIKTDNNYLPKEREDGTADYRDLGMVQNVKKGDLLCRIIPPEPGKDGMDIYGQPVPFKKGKLPPFPSGSNTVVSEDGLTLSSMIDGCVEYKNSRIDVNDMFVVRGDVDSATGNIDFLGTVTVRGDILEGFSVKAGKDIYVNGMVEGANLEAEGNIIISNGMNGMGKGCLKAEGNITGKYFENVTMECGGDIHADVIMNCEAHVGNAVILKGSKALLAGGSCTAGKQIYAGIIGSASNAKTQVNIVSEVLDKYLGNVPEGEDEGSLRAKLASLTEEIKKMDSQMLALNQVLTRNPNLLKAKTMKKSLINQKEKTESQANKVKEKISSFDQMNESFVDFNVIGVKIIYAGTKFKIGPFTLSLTNDYNNTKFYADKNGVVFTPVLPSDKIGY